MSLIALTSCNHDNDDNFRAFMSTATITGDSINGYYCYLDVGGIVISYDQALQNPDTLLLQLYYNPNIPENWTNIKTDYGSVSCDISNLATLQNWNDSVTIVVKEAEVEEEAPLIENNIDKIVSNASNDIAVQGGNAQDV